MVKSCESRNVIAIPSESVLAERLATIIAESKRLKLLIRTARELDRIVSSSQSREGQSGD